MPVMQLDPNRNTREEFTNAAQGQTIPDDAAPQWKELNQTLKDLMLKLVYHDSMAQNRVQPFMTPAASKNRVYFVWDFVGRTLVCAAPRPPFSYFRTNAIHSQTYTGSPGN
jgi:hypothetical protein